jgi:glycosyltransferase involved in cell wall biosynthesis
MKVALVYDRVNKWGGAERVLLALHKIFPKAPLYTSVYNKKKAVWAKAFNVKTSFLQKVPLASTFHEGFALLMPHAFESFNFNDYDLVISVTSESAKGIITGPNTTHICYCLTPTRYLWSGFNDYFRNPTFRFLARPAINYLKRWDKKASQRPDKYIAISKEVQKRIKKYYGRNSKIIYPPFTMLDKFVNNKTKENPPAGGKNEDYFLVVSRLTNFYKRVDLAIKACNDLKLNLKVVGTGLDESSLKNIAGPTIEFLGDLSDKKLAFYYKNCKALIFPGREDFGLTMVEAQAFGKPVVAFKGGGALDIIKHKKIGSFFNYQSVSSLKRVLKTFNNNGYNSLLCRKNAQRFSYKEFEKQFKSVINRYI